MAAWKGGHKKVCKPLSPEISEQLRGLAQQSERENRDFGKMRQLFRESQYEDLVKMKKRIHGLTFFWLELHHRIKP